MIKLTFLCPSTDVAPVNTKYIIPRNLSTSPQILCKNANVTSYTYAHCHSNYRWLKTDNTLDYLSILVHVCVTLKSSSHASLHSYIYMYTTQPTALMKTTMHSSREIQKGIYVQRKGFLRNIGLRNFSRPLGLAPLAWGIRPQCGSHTRYRWCAH
jgi:hypothetical protein